MNQPFRRKFGIEIEANPFMRWMFGNNVAWVFKNMKMINLNELEVTMYKLILRSEMLDPVLSGHLVIGISGDSVKLNQNGKGDSIMCNSGTVILFA